MKYLLISCLLMSGCYYQRTSLGDITIAQAACEGLGGIRDLWVYWDGEETVRCMSGHRIRFKDIAKD